jgi:hypothetical protein
MKRRACIIGGISLAAVVLWSGAVPATQRTPQSPYSLIPFGKALHAEPTFLLTDAANGTIKLITIGPTSDLAPPGPNVRDGDYVLIVLADFDLNKLQPSATSSGKNPDRLHDQQPAP